MSHYQNNDQGMTLIKCRSWGDWIQKRHLGYRQSTVASLAGLCGTTAITAEPCCRCIAGLWMMCRGGEIDMSVFLTTTLLWRPTKLLWLSVWLPSWRHSPLQYQQSEFLVLYALNTSHEECVLFPVEFGFCDSELSVYGGAWPETHAGNTVSLPCEGGMATRLCSSEDGGQWKDPDDSRCGQPSTQTPTPPNVTPTTCKSLLLNLPHWQLTLQLFSRRVLLRI